LFNKDVILYNKRRVLNIPCNIFSGTPVNIYNPIRLKEIKLLEL